MTVVVPVSAVTGVALSVLCGVCVLGDRPGLSGIAGADSGLWPVAAGRSRVPTRARRSPAPAVRGTRRVAAVLLLLPEAVRHPRRLRLPRARSAQALLIGAGAALGLILYLLAARQQLPAVAVVLASLYPALPVILGLVLPHERITRRQALGLCGAAAATVLLTLG